MLIIREATRTAGSPKFYDKLMDLTQCCWEQDPGDPGRVLPLAIARPTEARGSPGIPTDGKWEYSAGFNRSEASLRNMKSRELRGSQSLVQQNRGDSGSDRNGWITQVLPTNYGT